jgi:glycosyltransferase involved in cell wall biosynthesis
MLSAQVRDPPKIVFLPRMPSADYVRLYRAADAFVLATHAEGWGRPLTEAMAMALPTIAPAWCAALPSYLHVMQWLLAAAGTACTNAEAGRGKWTS